MEADTMEADTMEADTVYNATGDNDMDRDKACQVAPRQTDARAPAGAVQAHPNGSAMDSETAVVPANEKPFPFLRLPAEIRNMVYQYPCIYRTKSVQLPMSTGITYSNMRQPPITSVSRQIRYETLPVFYDIHECIVDLAPLDLEDRDDADKIRDRICNMLFGPIPGPDNTLQPSNLPFLSYLDVAIEIETFFESVCKFGFIMSSSPRLESDELDEEHGVVDTTDLDWDDTEDVRIALMEGIDSTEICQDIMDLLGVPGILCDGAYESMVEMAALMCLISRQCPQLTSNVLASVIEVEDELAEQLAEARGYLSESD